MQNLRTCCQFESLFTRPTYFIKSENLNCTSKVITINTTTSFVIYIIAGRYYYINPLSAQCCTHRETSQFDLHIKSIDWFPYEGNTGI